MSIEVTIHGVSDGVCSYSGKECEGITVTFADGTFTEVFVSTQTFFKFLKMKASKPGKVAPRPAVNGAPPVGTPK